MRSPHGLPLAGCWALRVWGNQKGDEHLGSPAKWGRRRQGRWHCVGLVADRKRFMAWTWGGSGDARPHVGVPCTHVGCVYHAVAAFCLAESLRTEATTLCEPSLEVGTSPPSRNPSAYTAWQSPFHFLHTIYHLSHVQ